jgi:hypothetical protein
LDQAPPQQCTTVISAFCILREENEVTINNQGVRIYGYITVSKRYNLHCHLFTYGSHTNLREMTPQRKKLKMLAPRDNHLVKNTCFIHAFEVPVKQN